MHQTDKKEFLKISNFEIYKKASDMEWRRLVLSNKFLLFDEVTFIGFQLCFIGSGDSFLNEIDFYTLGDYLFRIGNRKFEVLRGRALGSFSKSLKEARNSIQSVIKTFSKLKFNS